MKKMAWGALLGVLCLLLFQNFLRSAFWDAIRGMYQGGP